ncbi:MAG: RluA family pseudouridine synthase [Clostridiaceae bacterium]|nr:RluA family pseudouridine synthase [Clostridiaceae bacterium]
MDRLEYTVLPTDEGIPLSQLARRRMAVSATLLRQLKSVNGGILLDGEEVFVNVLPKAGQVVSLSCGKSESSVNVIPQQGNIDIVYEDELMLIPNKPRGIPVHPSRGHEKDTLANYVAGIFEKQGEVLVFRAINRLDSGTSGLMCIAKTKYASALLGKALLEGRIKREYYALCKGRPDPAEGTIDLPIARIDGRGIMRCVDPNGQRAVTHYRTLHCQNGVSLLRIELETGRTHQIRVHMAHIGHPLLGDFMYGEEIPGFDRVALHSGRIKISLPDREIDLETPPPPCFGRFIDLEVYQGHKED